MNHDYTVVCTHNNLTESFEFGTMARQANGSVLYRCGNTAILATVTYDPDTVVEEDFLPLTVQYIEKSYAAGKFPGGFIKREQKPGDFETLTARIVDRSLRPLFPKHYRFPTTIVILVLSCDANADLQLMALNAASAALYVSDLPIAHLVSGVRIGRQEGVWMVNPQISKLPVGTLDLFVAGAGEELLMIEMRSMGSDTIESPCASGEMGIFQEGVKLHCANALSEAPLLEALTLARECIAEACQNYAEAFAPHAKAKTPIVQAACPHTEALDAYLFHHCYDLIAQAVMRMAKSERMSELKNISRGLAKNSEVQQQGWSEKLLFEGVMRLKRQIVRAMILNEGRRPDGRTPKEVRPITIRTNLLPTVHGSALFTRGETQALVISTLGGEMDAQSFELLNEKGGKKERFMVHYNFPGFSVGEPSPVGPPGRRELGHGNLAKRALEPVLVEPNAQTVRLVSEILESNGSSSMATVCGGALALKASGVKITELVAGVAMGLVQEGEKAVVLTDIMGLEDHDGDMDFKVAGTHEGITAMQMDIKLGGLDFAIFEQALLQAKEARNEILTLMEEAAKKIVLNDSILPSSETFLINPSRIVDIIGQAGRTIKEIIERFEVSIDLDKERGEVKVTGGNKKQVDAAKAHIRSIAEKDRAPEVGFSDLYKEGEVLLGKVKKIVDFGAFIALPKGQDGLLHISKIAREHVQNIKDVLSEGQEIKVEVLKVSKNRIELGRVF